jgi:hypothetical protein
MTKSTRLKKSSERTKNRIDRTIIRVCNRIVAHNNYIDKPTEYYSLLINFTSC